jgi:hypothetical protein
MSPTIRIKPESPRAEKFQQVFGRLDRIPVIHDTPHLAVNFATGQEQLVYEMNVKCLTSTELTNLVSYYAVLINRMPDDVRRQIMDFGVQIDTDSCEVEA